MIAQFKNYNHSTSKLQSDNTLSKLYKNTIKHHLSLYIAREYGEKSEDHSLYKKVMDTLVYNSNCEKGSVGYWVKTSSVAFLRC